MDPQESAFPELRAQADQLIEAMERRLEDLERREQRAEALDARMREAAARCEDRVRLNVGGQVFETHKSNLLRFEGSFFHGMLCGGQWRPDESGCFFIDANPSLFGHVMDVLRGEPLLADGLTRGEVQRLRALFDYLLLPCPDALTSPPPVEPAVSRRNVGSRPRALAAAPGGTPLSPFTGGWQQSS